MTSEQRIEAAANAMRSEVAAMHSDESFSSMSVDVFYERQAERALAAADAVEASELEATRAALSEFFAAIDHDPVHIPEWLTFSIEELRAAASC